MKQLNKEIIILSAELSTLSEFENTMRTNQLNNSLKSLGVSFKEIQGYYKNTKETSFVVVLDNNTNLKTIQGLASHFNQECILFSDSDRVSKLVYPNGNETSIGTLKSVSKFEATKHDNYSYCSDLDQYFICN